MQISPQKSTDSGSTAPVEAEVQRYCLAHPKSPSAVRRPKIMPRGQLWIALLGSTLEEGIAGTGQTIAAALHSFDAQYRKSPKSGH